MTSSLFLLTLTLAQPDTLGPGDHTRSLMMGEHKRTCLVEDSIQTWVKLNGCEEKAKAETLSKDGDEMKVTRKTYGGGKDESEVVLVVIEEGGHTWPGMTPPASFMGKSAKNVSANDLMWEFFQKHKLK